MVRKGLLVVCGVAATGLPAGLAWGQFSYDPFNVLSVRETIKTVNLGPADMAYDAYALSLDWQAVIGDPWSREAQFALASSPDPMDPNLVIYKFIDAPNAGRPDNGATNGDPATLHWSGRLANDYQGGDLWFIARQSFPGTQAHWTNISLTLDTFTPPPPPASLFVGDLFESGEGIEFNTFSSQFDTELAIFDAEGTLLANVDDSLGGNQGTSQIELPQGLGEGRYYIALTGYNAVFSDGFGVDLNTLQGSEGGAYTFAIAGRQFNGTHAPDTVTWFSFGVVPSPASSAVLGMAGLALVRRRRSNA